MMLIEEIKKSKPHTTYRLKDGTMVPGVTTVLGVMNKPALVPWANKLGLSGIEVGKYVDGLAEIGSLAHAMILCHLHKEKPDLSDSSPNQVSKAENCLCSFFEWEKQHTIEPMLLETPLVSETYGFGGTPDFVGRVDGQIEVIDFKTGKAIYEEHLYQAAAYEQLVAERALSEALPGEVVGVDRLRILQIGRDETEGFSEKVIASWDSHWGVFKACLDLYNARKVSGNGKRRKAS